MKLSLSSAFPLLFASVTALAGEAASETIRTQRAEAARAARPVLQIINNHVNTRKELIDYDPRLAKICREVFGDTRLRYTKPATRLTGHLEGYDPKGAPRFEWPKRLSEAKKQIRRAAQRRGK